MNILAAQGQNQTQLTMPKRQLSKKTSHEVRVYFKILNINLKQMDFKFHGVLLNSNSLNTAGNGSIHVYP